MIQVTSDIAEIHNLPKPLHLAMGVFDGIHLGHQEVINQVINTAKQDDEISGVLTFDPFPLQVIAPDRAPQRILANIAHKKNIIEQLGVEFLCVIPFDLDFAKLSARGFLDLIRADDKLTHISIGEDWKFGRGREGKLDFVKSYCTEHGIKLSAAPPVMHNGERISSTRIRQAIRDGNLHAANTMLGRSYSLFGIVERGEQIGRTIGFPTANINIQNELLPPNGVYAVHVRLDGNLIRGIANLGVRPTVNDKKQHKLEVHLFDFEQEIYGQEIEVIMGEYIRREKKFPNVAALTAQITKDCKQALNILS